MSRVFWDTMLFVYLFEDHKSFGPRVRHIRSRMMQRGDALYTSALAVGEVLAGFEKRGEVEKADQIVTALRVAEVGIIPFGEAAARRFARIRAQYGVSPPDSIHLACAAEEEMDLFLTNDVSLIGKAIPGIQFIDGLDSNLFG